MEKALKIEIVTPQSLVFSGNAVSISLPGSQSPFQVLTGHVAVVSTLDKGQIKIDTGDGRKIFESDGGFAEVNNNVVSVLVETAEEKV